MTWRVVTAGAAALAVVALAIGLRAGEASREASGPQASEAASERMAPCLACHGDERFSLDLEDGSAMSLYVNVGEFAKSVHGSQLICTDCHAKYDEAHPSGATFPSRRAYAIGAYEKCKKCHFDSYTRTLESVHYELIRNGIDAAPVCTDCHGSHAIPNPHEKRAMVSRSCATCHEAVYQTYARSVHGKGLVEDDNQDVPACADCHTHHQIEQPGAARFRLGSPEVCIRCHGDEPRMARYGISTDVARTYLADFHGVTASLAGRSTVEPRQVVVTCIDCHSSHDIASPKLLGEEAMKNTVAATCASCHQGAAANFPAAWLSHYRPSLQHAPLVYLVDRFYAIFIPFVVIGLVLHILLHVYRASAGR